MSLLLALSLPGIAAAQQLCALGHGGQPGRDTPASQLANQQMYAVQRALCSTYACPNYSFYQSANTNNAMASRNGYDYAIRYNGNFMGQVQSSFSNYATIGIFAHELGHIIDFYTNQSGNIPQYQREATADQFAGCAFKLAGEPRNNLIYLARALHALGASPGYPSPEQRVALLIDGYNRC